MHVCMCVCMYVRRYACLICTYVRMCVCTNVFMYHVCRQHACMHACMHAGMNVCACMHPFMQAQPRTEGSNRIVSVLGGFEYTPSTPVELCW